MFLDFSMNITYSLDNIHTYLLVADKELRYIFFSESSRFQGIPMAPLWDFGKGKFVGVISASDFILILREVCL